MAKHFKTARGEFPVIPATNRFLQRPADGANITRLYTECLEACGIQPLDKQVLEECVRLYLEKYGRQHSAALFAVTFFSEKGTTLWGKAACTIERKRQRRRPAVKSKFPLNQAAMADVVRRLLSDCSGGEATFIVGLRPQALAVVENAQQQMAFEHWVLAEQQKLRQQWNAHRHQQAAWKRQQKARKDQNARIARREAMAEQLYDYSQLRHFEGENGFALGFHSFDRHRMPRSKGPWWGYLIAIDDLLAKGGRSAIKGLVGKLKEVLQYAESLATRTYQRAAPWGGMVTMSLEQRFMPALFATSVFYDEVAVETLPTVGGVEYVRGRDGRLVLLFNMPRRAQPQVVTRLMNAVCGLQEVEALEAPEPPKPAPKGKGHQKGALRESKRF